MQGKSKEFKQLLKQLQDASLEDGALDEACSKMQALVEAVAPPASILKEAGELQAALVNDSYWARRQSLSYLKVLSMRCPRRQ